MEAKGHVRSPNVIINRLGQGHYIQALFAQQVRGFVCAITTQNDEAVQIHALIIGLHGLDLIHLALCNDTHQLKRLAGGAQNRTAQCQNTRKIIGLHLAVNSFN